MSKRDKALAATVNRLREERDLSQEALAFKAGVSTSTISRIERAEHYPSVPTLRKLAAGLGVPVGALMDD